MDLLTLKQLLTLNSISKINQICESKYQVTSDIKDIKLKIVEEYCSKNGYKLCLSEEDSILAALSGQSDEVIDYLADHGYMVIHEDKKNKKVLAESHISDIAAILITKKPEINKNGIPYFKKIPLNQFDLACPHCDAVMREKDYSFRYDDVNKCWTHSCKPDARILMEPS